MVSVQQLVIYCLVILVLPGSDVGVMVICVVLNAPSKQFKSLICLGCLSCHHVMSVCLPVKLCFLERQLTYFVRNVMSSLIIYI